MVIIMNSPGVCSLLFYLSNSKMKSFIKIFTVSLSCAIFSCGLNSKENENTHISQLNTNFENTLTLSESDSIIFSLDSVTSKYTSAIQYFANENDEKFLALLNITTNSIYIYNYHSKELDKIIRFETEGPNGVGRIEGFRIHSQDTIIVNSRYLVRLTDFEGKPFFKYDLFERRRSDIITGLVTNETRRPVVVYDKKMYLDIMPDIHFNDLDQIAKAKTKFIINLETSDYDADLKYPSKYTGGVYGIHFLAGISSTFNPKTKRFLYSFPAHENIIETDHENFFMEHYSGSECCNKIPYMENKNPSKKEYHQHFFTSPVYDMIIYDPYRDLYYRTVMLPTTSEKFNERDLRRDFIVVILNSDLKKVGEFLFEKSSGFNNGMIFVSEDGLNIHKSASPEDVLCFKTFEVVSIK
jgi:hypothetical protein